MLGVGVEIEYATFPVNHQSKINEDILEAAKSLIPSVESTISEDRSSGKGYFLSNGAWLHLDNARRNIEFSTDIVTDPYHLVCLEKGNEVLLSTIIGEHLKDTETKPKIFKNNINYAGKSWGYHENYLIEDYDGYPKEELLPFLVSRQIFCGSGKLSPNGTGFEFSQRSSYIKVTDANTTGANTIDKRFLIGEKERCEEYGCIHLICGDSTLSELSSYLKVATTLMVIHLLEIEGPDLVGEGFQLLNPIKALHKISLDLELKKKYKMKNGRELIAIQIQMKYLRAAKKRLRCLPSWARLVIKKWEEVLHALNSSDYTFLSMRLDNFIKYALLSSKIEKFGITWEAVRDWMHFFSEEKKEGFDSRSFMKDRKLKWRDRARMREIINHLITLDLRYHELGSGIFYALDRGGLLKHKICLRRDVKKLIEYPPPSGRAWVRGKFIRRLSRSDKANSATSSWNQISDGYNKYRLSDPLNSSEISFKGG
jgi:proteasome accessory factor A